MLTGSLIPIFHGEVDIEHVYLLRLLTNANEEIRRLDIAMNEILCMFNCMCMFNRAYYSKNLIAKLYARETLLPIKWVYRWGKCPSTHRRLSYCQYAKVGALTFQKVGVGQITKLLCGSSRCSVYPS